MNKRVLSLSILLILSLGGYYAIQVLGSQPKEDTATLRQKIIYYSSFIIQKMHYSPKDINDSLSERIFASYLHDMDKSSDVFLASDIEELQKYKYSLDDEMLNLKNIAFMPAVSSIYAKRNKESRTIYQDILSTRFDYTIDESYLSPSARDEKNIELNDDNKVTPAPIIPRSNDLDFPTTLKEKRERWRKKLKSECIGIYYSLMEEETNKRKDTSYKNYKSFDSLELQARKDVLRRYDRAYKRMNKVFTEEAQFSLYMNTIMNIMDPHSIYLAPIDARSYEENTSGKFYGIGAVLGSDGNYVKIVSVSAGGAAWKSKKVEANDKILKVAEGNDSAVDLMGYEAADAVKLIRGDKGTVVRLTLQKTDGRIVEVSIVRDKIFINATFARSGIIPYKDKKIGYIYLPEFYNSVEKDDAQNPESSVDVKNELLKLKEQHVDGIIFDLRNNGGGYLLDAIRMAGWFIPKGPIVQVKAKEAQPYILDDKDTSVVYNGPLAVLINEYSASASEIFAAAMQDYGRALIVGSRSFGKGTVQKGSITIADLFKEQENLGTMNLTVQKFYRINGQSTQLKGVMADVVIPSKNDYLEVREKDIPYALPYDSIPICPYAIYNPQKYNYTSIAKQINAETIKLPYYNAVKDYAKFLIASQEKPLPLNLNAYKKELKTREEYHARLDSLSKKMSPTIKVQIIAADSIRYSKMDSTESGLFFEWYKNLNSDPTLSYTTDIIARMLPQHKQTPIYQNTSKRSSKKSSNTANRKKQKK